MFLKEYNDLDKKERKLLIAKHRYKIMILLNLDLSNKSLKDLLLSIAKIYINEISSVLNNENFLKTKLYRE